MKLSSKFKELVEMNLQLREDSTYPVRTVSRDDFGFLWLLECQIKPDADYLRIVRETKTDESQDEEGFFYVCLNGPNFGHFFEHFFKDETSKYAYIPKITFPEDRQHDTEQHDDSRLVNIQCKVFKMQGRRHFNATSKKVFTVYGSWEFPKFLIEKEIWSTSFFIIHKSEHASVNYEVILTKPGKICFQTKQVVRKNVSLWGKLIFNGYKFDFMLVFHPGELKQQVCKIKVSEKSNPGEVSFNFQYMVCMAVDNK